MRVVLDTMYWLWRTEGREGKVRHGEVVDHVSLRRGAQRLCRAPHNGSQMQLVQMSMVSCGDNQRNQILRTDPEMLTYGVHTKRVTTVSPRLAVLMKGLHVHADR